METKIMTTTTFTHPAVEAHIANLDAELIDFTQQQAKEDAQHEAELTESIFSIKVRNPVQSRVQQGIDFIRSTLLPTSKMFEAKEAEKAALEKVQDLTNEINDMQHKLLALKRKQNSTVLDLVKVKYRKWFIIIAVFAGVADGTLAYTSFRRGSYEVFLAAIASLAIATIIAVSHFFLTKWIKANTTNKQQFFRVLITLAVAFIFFSFIGNLRADAHNDLVNIALDGNTVSLVSVPYINGWAVAIISFVLFVAVILFSLVLWRSKTERLREEEYNKLSLEIKDAVKKITALENAKSQLEHNLIRQRGEARRCFDYAINAIRRCKTMAKNSITNYKLVYARFRNNVIPPFFETPCDFSFDESFQFNHQANPEPV